MRTTDDYISSSFPNLFFFYFFFMKKCGKTFFSLLHSEMESQILRLTRTLVELCLFVASMCFHIVMWILPEAGSTKLCAIVRQGSMKASQCGKRDAGRIWCCSHLWEVQPGFMVSFNVVLLQLLDVLSMNAWHVRGELYPLISWWSPTPLWIFFPSS